MSTTTSHSNMFEAAETAEPRNLAAKLAAKLAKRREERERNKAAQKAHRDEVTAELQERREKQHAWVAAYHEERRAECERDPTDPRNVAWMKRQAKEERLANSRSARARENSKTVAASFGKAIWDVLVFFLS